MSPTDCPKYELELDDIPLCLKTPFSSGIRRQKVAFVKASLPGDLPDNHRSTKTGDSNVSDLYLQLVAGAGSASEKVTDYENELESPEPASATTASTSEVTMCDVCKITVDTSQGHNRWNEHEASVAHELSLPHSHPPSALDRSRMGLGYLKSYGWDPDSRRGLGVAEQGMQYPIKAKVKDGNLGIGYKDSSVGVGTGTGVSKAKPHVLTARERHRARQKEQETARRLHEEFFYNDDVLRYLSHGSI
ncbi:hypothetical protein Cpir12675_002578 [Ceratocystis pirilliformis]|uniref:G-patch domain-containing protein n=1 Tax=Ceratocystis pirilliformis TaxID=259994 RepID=A0ABR3Z9B5_9PEZI